jgi:hypothetical protein
MSLRRTGLRRTARASLAVQRVANAGLMARQREHLAALRQELKAKAALARARRNAKMPMRTNVNVRWTSWTTVRGRRQSHEHHAENVSVRTAGAVSYVIYPDGREQRVATKNLEYV